MARAFAVAFALFLVPTVVVGCTTTAEPVHPSQSRSSASAQANDSSSPKPTPPKMAAVTIAGVDVDGRSLTVAGFVSGVSEGGGVCEFIVTSETTGAMVKVQNSGIENVRDTSCGSVQIPIEKFARGAWSTTLEYSSSSTKVTSKPLKVLIP